MCWTLKTKILGQNLARKVELCPDNNVYLNGDKCNIIFFFKNNINNV